METHIIKIYYPSRGDWVHIEPISDIHVGSKFHVKRSSSSNFTPPDVTTSVPATCHQPNVFIAVCNPRAASAPIICPALNVEPTRIPGKNRPRGPGRIINPMFSVNMWLLPRFRNSENVELIVVSRNRAAQLNWGGQQHVPSVFHVHIIDLLVRLHSRPKPDNLVARIFFLQIVTCCDRL